MTRFLAVAALLAVPVSPDAAPEGGEEHSAGLWHLSHLSDPVTGKFNYCAVENAFDNGLTLAFARNREFNTNIVVSFPDKRLQDHSRYKMLVAVDNNPVRDMTAFSADPTILVVPLQRDRKLLDWLQKGKLLELRGPQDSVKFALDGANDAFHRLQACVEQGLKDEAGHVTTPGQAAKGTQIATAEAAQPMSPDMVQPLPLPDSSSAVQVPPSEVAKPVAAAPAQAAGASVPSVPPVSQAASTPAVTQPPVSVAVVAPGAPSAAMQRFLDKQKAPEATSSSVPSALIKPTSTPVPATTAPFAQVASALPVVSALPPDRPAEPPRPAAVIAPASQAVASVAPVAAPQPSVIPPQNQTVVPTPVAAVPPPSAPVQPQAKPVPVAAPAELPDLADILKSAGITPARACRKDAASCQWHGPDETGSVARITNKQPLLEAMLEDADKREAACKGHFTAENGAPATRKGIESAQAIYKCDGMVQTALYATGADKTLAIIDGVAADKQSLALATRQKIAASMGIATNYQ